MGKAIDVCPVCHHKKLEQEFHHITPRGPLIIGGEVTSHPAILGGCSCNNCGTKFKFNKKGPCPNCEGTGEYTYVTSHCGTQISSRTTKCPTCNGTGQVT